MSDKTILKTLIVDDEPLAVERMEVICAKLPSIDVIGSASDGAAAVEMARETAPDLLLLDITMPERDGLDVARALGEGENPPAIVFVTAHENFAVAAFDLDAVDYVLKPVTAERLERAVERAVARHSERAAGRDEWLREFWVPHRSELIRIAARDVWRVDAERDYVRLHVGEPEGGEGRSYLLLQTIAGLEARLDPDAFIRVHRSTILRKQGITGLRHDGLGVWSVELGDAEPVRIGRTYLPKVKAMAGR